MPASAPELAFAAMLSRAFGAELPGSLGLAVSGGGDSMALLHLAADWARSRGTRLAAATVDHGLRPEARAEAQLVAETAEILGVAHRVLDWRWDRQGNLQDAARRGRYRVLADWAKGQGLAAVLLGHTRDDQAETLLMRLARGSGVDGLAAMAPERQAHGVRFLRPLLEVRRDALRRALADRGATWAEDPSNDDPAFERVRIRHAMDALDLNAERLAETAARMADARTALQEATHALAAAYLTLEGGDLLFPRARFAAAPAEIRHRLLAHLLRWRTAWPYRPRYRPLRTLAEHLAHGSGGTLHGCQVSVDRGTIRIAREFAAVAQLSAPPDRLWDGFWCLKAPPHSPPASAVQTVRALGRRALGALPDSQGPRPPRASLMASPAVFEGDRLVAAPLAGLGEKWTCRPAFTVQDCLDRLLSH